MKRSALELTVETFIKRQGIQEPEVEYRFHPNRRWRFDFAWPEHKIALEVDGGTYSNGRHTRGAGFHKDCEKLNEAVKLGWRVLRMDAAMAQDEAYVGGILAAVGLAGT